MASAARAAGWHGGGTDASGAGIGGDGASGAGAAGRVEHAAARRAAPRASTRSRLAGLRAVRLAVALLVCAGLHLAPAGDARAQTTVLDATMTGGSGSSGLTIDAVDVQLWGYRADEFGSLSDTTFTSRSVDYTITMVGQGSKRVGADTFNTGVFLLIEPAANQAFLDSANGMRWTYRVGTDNREANFAISEATHTVVGSTSLFRWAERDPGGLTSPVRVRITTDNVTGGGDYGSPAPGAGEEIMFSQLMEVGSKTYTWLSTGETLSGFFYRLSIGRLPDKYFRVPGFRTPFTIGSLVTIHRAGRPHRLMLEFFPEHDAFTGRGWKLHIGSQAFAFSDAVHTIRTIGEPPGGLFHRYIWRETATRPLPDMRGGGSAPVLLTRARSMSQESAPEPGPLSAELVDAPATHDGAGDITFELRFNRALADGFSDATLKGSDTAEGALSVTGGTLESVERIVAGDTRRWRVTVSPASADEDVFIALAPTFDCAAANAICSASGEPLSVGLARVVLAAPATSQATQGAESGPPGPTPADTTNRLQCTRDVLNARLTVGEGGGVRGFDAAADGRGMTHRIAGEMRVTRGRGHHPVAEQIADHRQALAEREGAGSERMPQVMQADVFEPRVLAHPVPGVVEVDQAGALLPAREHPRIAGRAGEAVEHSRDGGGQRHHPRTGLRIREPHLAGVEIQVVPAKPEDFVAPASGQHEEADGGRRMGRGEPLGGSRPERLAEPEELLAGEEPLVLLDPEAGHAPARVAAGWPPAPRIRQIEHLDQDVGRPVGDGRHAVQAVVEGEDVLVLDICDEALAEGRHDMLAQHEPVVVDGQGLAVHRDILALVALGEGGDGRVGRGFGRNRRLPGLDARDDVGGLLAGVVDGEAGVAMPTEADALGAAEGTRLDDEDLLARGIYSNPEAGKVVIPEDGVLAVDREAVHGTLGEGAELAFGHGAAVLRGGICAAISGVWPVSEEVAW